MIGYDIYWLNPVSGDFSMNTGAYYYGSPSLAITCPGYSATLSADSELWGLYVAPVGEVEAPNMRASFATTQPVSSAISTPIGNT